MLKTDLDSYRQLVKILQDYKRKLWVPKWAKPRRLRVIPKGKVLPPLCINFDLPSKHLKGLELYFEETRNHTVSVRIYVPKILGVLDFSLDYGTIFSNHKYLYIKNFNSVNIKKLAKVVVFEWSVEDLMLS